MRKSAGRSRHDVGQSAAGDGVVHDGNRAVRARRCQTALTGDGHHVDGKRRAIFDAVAADGYVAGAAGFEPPVFGRHQNRRAQILGQKVVLDRALTALDQNAARAVEAEIVALHQKAVAHAFGRADERTEGQIGGAIQSHPNGVGRPGGAKARVHALLAQKRALGVVDLAVFLDLGNDGIGQTHARISPQFDRITNGQSLAVDQNPILAVIGRGHHAVLAANVDRVIAHKMSGAT